MKKSLQIIASAAMAFSMFASVALADTTKTTSSTTDYKDLTGIDTGLKTKIDALISQGVFEGVSSDTFGISQNMTRAQFAKVASLIFNLQVDMSVRTSSFSDVRADDSANGWSIPYIEAAKKAGLIDGITDTTFAPGDNVTVGQLDTVFAKGLGKTINTAANPWYADAVQKAKDMGIHPSNKAGDAAADRSDLVISSYASWKIHQGTPQHQDQVSISAVTASGDLTVQVTLDKEIDTSKATLSLTKGTTAIPTTTEWSSDKKSAKLTLTGEKLSNGDYKVTLGGLDASLIKTASGSLTIGSSITDGNTNYAITDNYDLANVIDSDLIKYASGTDGNTSKSNAENPITSKFAKEIKLKATTSGGDSVAMPGIIQSISSSDQTIVKTAVSTDNRGYILGNKAGSASITIQFKTISGKIEQKTLQINVKSDPVTAKKVVANETSYDQSVTVTGGVYKGQFNAYTAMDLKVTDNYGITYEKNEIRDYNFALATFLTTEAITGDSNDGAVGTVTIDKDGTIHISGNVTGFDLTAGLSGGEKATTRVHVNKN